MADFIGTPNPDLLTGTNDADVIQGLDGNDTLSGAGGNDTIQGGSGADTLSGGDGDDLFIEDDIPTWADTFNGGSGTDTIELRAHLNPIVSQSGLLSPHAFTSPSTLTSVERIVFTTQPGQVISATLLHSAVQTSGLGEVVAGAGRDMLTFGTGASTGNFTMPTLLYTGFSAAAVSPWEDNTGDRLILVSSISNPGAGVTLNAADGLNILQVLVGGAGHDTLNGSANGDILNGAGGANALNGNDGNDLLVIANSYTPNGQGGFNQPSVFSGLGSTLNGGAGTDVLSIGGEVYLQATLISVEGVHLTPGFTPPLPITSGQEAALLILDSAHIAMLPSNAFFAGTGTVAFTPNDGTSLSLANYIVTPGSLVHFLLYAGFGNGLTFTGSSIGDYIKLSAGNQAALGGDGDDILAFGNGNQVAIGGAGADSFRIGAGSGLITDFTIGSDKLDFTDTGVSNVGRVRDLTLEQVGANTVISADTGGVHFEFVLQNIDGSNLSEADVILSDEGSATVDFGTTFDDLLFGFSQNDSLRGGNGNDRIYGGGGIDDLRGEDGNDTIVLDGAIGLMGTYLGGNGFDTLMLRSYGTNSLYAVFGTINTIERLEFDSLAGETLVGSISYITTTSGMSLIRGGDGADVLSVVVGGPGSFNLSGLTLDNWNWGVAAASGGDALVLTTAPNVTGAVTLTARNDIGNQSLVGGQGGDTLNGSGFADYLRGNAGDDTIVGAGGGDQLLGDAGVDQLNGGLGDDTIDGGSNVDTAVIAGNLGAYTVNQTAFGVFSVVGADGSDTLSNVEYLQFSDQLLRLRPGAGTTVDFTASPSTYMFAIRDFDGNDLGAASGWKRIGAVDVNGDGDVDQILVNKDISRFAEVGTAPDGKVYFGDYGWAGETRVVGIYIDPLVQSGEVVANGPHDSQRRFQNDLAIDNIAEVLGAGDYDRDGLQEVYFGLTDGTAYLHAYMHADGNIRYANYQSQQQVIDFLAGNGWAASTYDGWFS